MIVETQDLYWSKNGDFVISDGDLLDTTGAEFGSFLQETRTRVCSSTNDWRDYPNIAANLEDYIGEKNAKTTGTSIERRVKATLIGDGAYAASDIEVRAVPVSMDMIAVVVTGRALDPKTGEVRQKRAMFSFLNSSEINPNIVSLG